MDISQIISVVKITELQSFSKAADALYVSQSALSLRIRKLEEELGFAIFERGHQKLSLTTPGEAFYEYSLPLVRDWDTLNEQIAQYNGYNPSTIRVGVIPTARDRKILDPILDFISSNESLKIELLFNTANCIMDMIRSGEIDVGIAALNESLEYPDRPTMNYCYLRSEETCLLVSKQNPLSKLDSITLSEVEKHAFVGYSNDNLNISDVQRTKNLYGINPTFNLITEDINTCYDMVERNMGVRLDPICIARNHDVVAIHLDPPILDSHIHMMYLNRNADSGKIRKFKDHIFKHYNTTEAKSVRTAPYLGE